MEPKLTPREREILICLTRGVSHKEISERLGIALNTTRKHVLNIYRKTDSHSKVEILCWCEKNELYLFGGTVFPPSGGAE